MAKESIDEKYLSTYYATFENLFNDLQLHLQESRTSDINDITSTTDIFLSCWTDVLQRATYSAVHSYHNILREQLLKSGIDIGEF